MSRIASACILGLVSALALTACTPAEKKLGLQEINAEFAETIEPLWELDASGIYGEPAIADGMVAVYLKDDEVGLRVAVYSAADGELLWDHVASPGGAWGAPLFHEQDSASRPYPVPTIQPLMVPRGNKGEQVLVFFERSKDDSLVPDDILHVVEARTGEELEVTLPEYDEDEDYLDYLHPRDDGTIGLNAYSPGWLCAEGPTLCFEEPEGGNVELDIGALEARTTERLVPEDPDMSMSREWGHEFLRDSQDDVQIVRFADGAALWQRATDELFGGEYTVPPPFIEFIRADDLYLIQGYQGLAQNPDIGELSLDIVEARTLVAVDRETGETRWTLDGGDSRCYAVADFPRDPDAAVLPMCLASAGSFVHRDGDFADFEEPEASIVGVNVADGSIEWEVEQAGTQPIAFASRLTEAGFASRGRFAVAPKGYEELTLGLIDLASGTWLKSPEKATFACESERTDVELEFEGSAFTGGSNPISLGYPGGWYSFACDDQGEAADLWSKGAVRVAGYPAGGGLTILMTENGITAFDLEED